MYFVPPEYHHDPASGLAPVLAFRNYGRDILQRMLDAGFAQAEVVHAPDAPWFGCARPVLVGRKSRADGRPR